MKESPLLERHNDALIFHQSDLNLSYSAIIGDI